jgi:hypothetical protein
MVARRIDPRRLRVEDDERSGERQQLVEHPIILVALPRAPGRLIGCRR